MDRVLSLQGGRNFRDLGGYRTRDGRRVRWRLLFRSGVLSYLTDADWAHLASLGIRTVCDLRAPHERAREPVPQRAASMQWDEWDYDPQLVSLRGQLKRHATLTNETARASMTALYREFPSRFATQFAAIFRRLASGDVPLIIHCSAGKDRTGLAAALVLSSLGVARPDVLADYVLTDTGVDLEHELITHRRSTVGVGEDHDHVQLAAIAREARLPLLAAHPDYLEAAFDSIEADYGSLDGYLRQRLGLADSELDDVRRRLLDAA
jgi:protein-tyrosine phosphatase